VPTTVVTTVHKDNLAELLKIRDFLLDKNIAWQIQIATPIGRFPRELILSKEEFYSVSMFIASSRNIYSQSRLPIIGAHSIGYYSRILRNTMLMPLWKGCQAGISTFGILSDGGVKGCISLPDSFVEDNIRNRDIKDIWGDTKMFSYNRNFTKDDLNGDCKKCKHGKICKGGCLTVSTSLTGMNHCDPYCQYLIEKEMIIR
jgi:radical SAM protein with 4Fe4S-binding SPASM domain